jgi:hypothetical protein
MLPELERLLRERLDALGPAPRAELLYVLIPVAKWLPESLRESSASLDHRLHRDEAGSVVGRPAYEMAYRSIDGQPEPIHA